MPHNLTRSAHQAAEFARNAAGGGAGFEMLSSQMCWDAVYTCQTGQVAVQLGVNVAIDLTDADVTNANADSVPEGATIGFFRGGHLVHAMISLGNGQAAGNKNACIGVGSPIGWEILSLRDTLTAGLEVRYRPM